MILATLINRTPPSIRALNQKWYLDTWNTRVWMRHYFVSRRQCFRQVGAKCEHSQVLTPEVGFLGNCLTIVIPHPNINANIPRSWSAWMEYYVMPFIWSTDFCLTQALGQLACRSLGPSICLSVCYFQEGSETCLKCGNQTKSLPGKDGCTTNGCNFTAAPGVVYDLNKLSRPFGPMIEVVLDQNLYQERTSR